jgi:hypothetical protein
MGRAKKLAALRDELASERNARVILAETVEAEIGRLREELAQAEMKSGESAPREVAPQTIPSEPSWFELREHVLSEQGIPRREARQLQQRLHQTGGDWNRLRERAKNEGWVDSTRFKEATDDLKWQLREKIGEESYDKILYASGQPNRVQVDATLHQSAAERAGVLAGDLIFSYGGLRVFDPESLLAWTSEGEFGERVEVEILRGDELIDVTVARGPLGLKTTAILTPPRP